MSVTEASYTEVEQAVWNKVRAGQVADLRSRDRHATDWRASPSSGGMPRVRAEALKRMLTTPLGAGEFHAVRLRGAELAGDLNLGGCVSARTLELRDCYIGGRVSLARAVLPAVSFRGSVLAKGLSGRRLTVAHVVNLGYGFQSFGRVLLSFAEIGVLNLNQCQIDSGPETIALDGFGMSVAGTLFGNRAHFSGEVRLLGARVAGDVEFVAAHLINPHGNALNADRFKVIGGIFCRYGFMAHGQVRMLGGNIGADADFDGAQLLNPSGVALNASRLTLGWRLSCRKAVIHGQVQLTESVVGTADFQAARLISPGRVALSADRIVVTRSFICSDGFAARGSIRLAGAHIGGTADFDGAQLLNPGGNSLYAGGMNVGGDLFCRNSFVSHGEIGLPYAQIVGNAEFDSARLVNPGGDSLYAGGMSVGGDLFCDERFTSRGRVGLPGARVAGNAQFRGARLLNPGGNALVAARMTIGGSLLCDERFTARGRVGLTDARVAGNAQFHSARLLNPGGDALDAARMTIGGNLLCREEFICRGHARLTGAHVSGDVEFAKAWLINLAGIALNARGLTVSGNFFLGTPFQAEGQIRLINAHVNTLDLGDARLISPNGIALYADYLTTASDLLCGTSLTVQGEVRLIGAKIGGNVNFDKARLCNEGGDALTADNLDLAGDLFCREGFETRGQIRLMAAKIGGNAEFDKAWLSDKGGVAMTAENLDVAGDLFCREGFGAYGQIRLIAARIGGDLSFIGGTIIGDGVYAIDLESAEVSQTLRLKEMTIIKGIIDAFGTRARHLDDMPNQWPRGSRLTGFTYGSLPDGTRGSPSVRLAWLQGTAAGKYLPQTYDQLASAYRAGGNSRAARSVLIARQQASRRLYGVPSTGWRGVVQGVRSALLALWSWFLRWTIGYGYAPWRGLIWFTISWAFASFIFSNARDGEITAVPTLHDQFHSVIYALDLLLPVVNLKQRDNWIPHHAYYWWTVIFTIVGWLIATIVVAGLANIFKRE